MAAARLVHMASMARSGETMLLNALNNHSKMKIAGQLKDTVEGKRRLKLFKTWEPTYIDTAHRLFTDLSLNADDIVIVKQGVWEHPWPFEGFILVRNPLSVYASLKRYDSISLRSLEALLHFLGMPSAKRKLKGNYWRFYRWFRDVDADLYHRLDSLDILDIFCCFYNRRMGQLLTTGLPIIHYEQLVSEPRETLEKLCAILSVPFEQEMLQVTGTTVGHGKNDLGRAISDSSLHRIDNLKASEIDHILIKTHATWSGFGYALNEGRLDFSITNDEKPSGQA